MTSNTENLLKRAVLALERIAAAVEKNSGIAASIDRIQKQTAPKPALTAEELGRKIAESVAFCNDLEQSAYEAFKENRKDEQ